MWIFVGFAILFVGIVVFASIQAKKRREALSALANELGLQFDPDGGMAHERFDGFTPFGVGSSRRSYNLLSGMAHGMEWEIFDYRYTTGGGKNKSTYHFSIVSTAMPILIPNLTIRPEGVFDKLVGLAGFDDINFESEEFSRRYHVNCEDRKTCYDVIHPQMIEFFLSIEPMSWQFRGRRMVLATRGHNSPEKIRRAMELTRGFCDRIPEYVKSDRPARPV